MPGVCSLQQLLEESNFNIEVDQAVKVFMILLESIILMKERGYNPTNLNPKNIYLVRTPEHENTYALKSIDIEELNKLECAAYTPVSFNNPSGNYKCDQTAVFKDSEDKFKNIFCSVIRIFYFILHGIKN